MERKTTSLKINPDVWKEAKLLAVRRGIDLSDLVEELIKRELKKK